VDVADRGADTFEFLDHEQRNGRHYVIRSSKDRSLAGEDHVGADRIYQHLHEYARDLPVLCERQVQVHANRGGSKTQRTHRAGEHQRRPCDDQGAGVCPRPVPE